MAFGGQSNNGKRKERATDAGSANGHLRELEDGEGYEMGSGRGKGSDGAGAYEMVGMAPRGNG